MESIIYNFFYKTRVLIKEMVNAILWQLSFFLLFANIFKNLTTKFSETSIKMPLYRNAYTKSLADWAVVIVKIVFLSKISSLLI